MKRLRILVVGGGGYIGTLLVTELIKNKFHVRCFDRFSSSETLSRLKLNKDLEIIVGKIQDIDSEKFLDIDIVIDLIAITKDLNGNENEIIQINRNARMKIIEMSKKKGASQYIRISSSNVYAGSIGINNEKQIPSPKTLYSKINLELDKYAISLNDEKFGVTILRLASIFGDSPRMRWDQSINNMIKEFYINGKINVKSKSSKRPFLHIKDAIRAIILVIQSKKESAGEIFNVGSNDMNYSMEEVANEIGGKENVTLHDSKDENSFTMDCIKIKNKLGFEKKYDLGYGINEISNKLKQEKTNSLS
ncbi:UDP-glucose 4-epimerase protein [Marine Group I thaumarchaeote SCGC AAA799-P11]|uniref:UDP-glucose 4-epimerase protein n=1 Tax=Marine Group I thaumarchaeote SCGC AAA799-P11 TaxID=1502295 RepID=A0A087S316_9ARCH|nr:UDP-glucose 4-epimerase protein [Marine Group I thaumarchaeote SCGC AAA799-P11]